MSRRARLVMILSLLVLACGPAAPVGAQVAGQGGGAGLVQDGATASAGLLRALDMPGMIAVMRDEGLAYGLDLETGLFGAPGDVEPIANARWRAEVARIYDADRMTSALTSALDAELPPDLVPEMTAFFTTPLGKRIVALEISARKALLDQEVEDASRAALDKMRADRHPRLAVLGAFIAAGDLLEANVAGALNANLAFYQGMLDGVAFPDPVGQDQAIADVWAQETEIRTETEHWLYSYLGMAYQPLSDADLDAYVAFSAGAAGKALNRALFAAFDTMFTGISRDLGLGAARYLSGQDI